MIVKCVVVGEGFRGPDFFFVKVECTQEQYDNGYHYVAAQDWATEEGYCDNPMVVIDENDPPGQPPEKFFDLFHWDSATIIQTPLGR